MNIVLIRFARRRPLPKTPVELRRNWNLLADADGLSRVAIPSLGEVSPSDQAIVYLVDSFIVGGVGTPLVAHLHQLAIFLLNLDQQRALGGVVAAWFFNIDVLAGLHAGDGHRRVPVVGHGNGDGVNIF